MVTAIKIDFLSNWGSMRTKSSLRKFDMCPGCPASLDSFVTADWLEASLILH
jgi:hypothetical protein